MNEMDVLDRVRQVYDSNKWHRAEADEDNPIILNDLVNMCLAVNDKERVLIVNLIEHFYLLRNYGKFLRPMMLELEYFTKTFARIVLLPIRDPSINRVNSGDAIIYELTTFRKNSFKDRIINYNTPFSSDLKIAPSDIIVFVDDFIGTGNQFFEMWAKFVKIHAPANVYVRCIVAMEDAVKEFSKNEINFKPDVVFGKAISSGRYVSSMDLATANATYDAIESKTRVPAKFSRGYGGSEAIVALKNTPNNTLPIFWFSSTKGGLPWPAPFPRA